MLHFTKPILQRAAAVSGRKRPLKTYAVEYISILVLCSLVYIDTGTVQSGIDWHCLVLLGKEWCRLVKLGTDGIAWYSLFVCKFWWVGSGQPHGNWEWT